MKQQTNIYIEGLALVEGHFSGIGQYILGILQGIDTILDDAKIVGRNHPNVYVVIPKDTIHRFHSFGFKHIQYKTVPFSFRIMSGLWHRGKMPPLDIFCGKGYYIFTRFVGMPLLFSKSAIVIYDISFELFPQYTDERNLRFLSSGIKQYLKKVDQVITISSNAKREIADYYSYPKSKITIATPAVDPTHFYKRSQEEIDRVKEKYGLSGDYILTLSNLEPRKNLDGVVDAYCMLPKKLTSKNSLVLVGVNGWKTESLFEKIVEKVKQGYNITRPSEYVSDEDKPALISGAKILVYPSHYEGFGMPPLEALSCGVPVITSNNSSLPEVVGDIGTMIPSSDTKALANAIEDGIKNYIEISSKIKISGPKQAENFSWTESARSILDMVENA